MTTVIDIKG